MSAAMKRETNPNIMPLLRFDVSVEKDLYIFTAVFIKPIQVLNMTLRHNTTSKPLAA